MKVVLQRVKHANVSINDKIVSKINKGILILIGISPEDNSDDIDILCDKIINLRIFEDTDQKMNLSLKDIAGEILIVPNFTLYADCKKGKRPSFSKAAKPDFAKNMFEKFCNKMNAMGLKSVEQGVFGADMKVELLNDGPVTIMLNSKEL